MASLYELRGGDALANTVTAGNQDGAEIAYLSDGRFVIVWRDSSASGGDTSGSSIRAQIFNPDGSKSGAEFLVNTATAGEQREPVVTALAGGGFAIAWTDRNSASDGSSTSVKARIYDSAGAPAGGEFLANTSTAGGQLTPSIAGVSGGGFVLAWSDAGSNDSDIKAQRFDSAGAKLGGELAVNVQVAGTQAAPDVSVLADGRFVLVWGEGNSIAGRIFNADGTAAGGEFAVAAAMGIAKDDPQVAALAGGGFAVTWTDHDESGLTGGTGVRVRVYDSAGAALGPGVAAHSQAAGSQGGSSITALATGGFAVIWTDSVSGSGSVKAQLFDSAGARDGGEFVVNQVEAGSQFASGIAAGADGFTIVWTDFSGVGGDSSGSGVKASRFVLSPATGAGDSITGTEGADVLHGLGGDDSLTGLGGNDLLDGGAGADSMTGGLGDDVYHTDVAEDQIVEEEDSGDDTVWTTRSTVLSANLEDLRGELRAGNLALTGNELDNYITGTWGDDRIDGGAGADRMEGGPGQDFYFIDNEGDSVFDEDYDPDQPVDETYGYFRFDYANVSITTYSMAGTGLDIVHGLLTTGHHFTGNELDNGMRGNSGDDWLDGAAGADSMAGRGGNDTYVVDNSGDGITENADGGTDHVLTGLAAYTLHSNVENLTGTSAAGQTLTGNGLSNVVTGGSGDDVLRLSHGGDDTVLAGAGNDNIFFIGALTAADVVNGGSGLDTLVVQGAYGSLTLTGNVTLIENISILGGNNTAFGEPGTNRHDYILTIQDSNFAAGVQARINGSALLAGEDFTFDGSAETDALFVVYGGEGRDTLTGGLGNDIFFYAEERFASGDTVNGGSGYDGMFLRGNYTIDFTAPGYTGLFTSIENLTLTSATDERYARGGETEFDYNLTLSDAIVGAGQVLTVSGALLMATETMVFDASQESDGALRLFGGKAADTLKGGANADLIHGNLGADVLAGNGGADAFRYQNIAESTAASMDQILDFTAGTDKIELDRIDANSLVAGNQAFTWIGSGAFTGSAGQVRAYEQGGTWFVEGDVNGDSIADLVVALTLQGPTPLGAGDFIL